MFSIYTPWKHQKIWVSGVFRGYKSRALARNELKKTTAGTNQMLKDVRGFLEID